MNLIPIDVEGYSIDVETGLIYSHKREMYLKMKPNIDGYGRTKLYFNGKRKWVFNHIKMVACYGDKFGNIFPPFVDSLRDLGLTIDHLNRNKMDARPDNLELVTHIENCRRRDTNVDCLPEL